MGSGWMVEEGVGVHRDVRGVRLDDQRGREEVRRDG